MRSLRACIVTCVAVLVISGCSGSGPSTDAARSASSAAPPSTSATAAGPATSASAPVPVTSPPPLSPAKLTAACPFLSVDELAAHLGISADGVTATEEKPEHDADGVQLGCDYRVNGKNLYSLSISGYPVSALSVGDLVDAVPTDARNKQKPSGIGQAAIFYTTSDGFGVMCTGAASHGQARTATFIAPKSVSQTTFADVAKLVVARL
jgi:hypothetical protein